MSKKDHSPEKKFETLSGIEVKPFYGPEDVTGFNYEKQLGDPGKPPFTRGIYQEMYRKQPWMILQLSGFETIEATRARMELLFKEGYRGYDQFDMYSFNLIPDVPGCSAAIDPDDPLARGLVGRCGTSLSTSNDFEILLKGLPLEKLHLSIISHSSAPAIYGLWISQAQKLGFPIKNLHGDLVASVDEGFLQSRRDYSPEGALRLRADLIRHASRHTPNINFNLDSYQIRDRGANAVQELGFCLARAIASIEECLKRDVSIDAVASLVTFHMSCHNDFFEEICKLRAMRRMWTKIIRDRFHSKKPQSYRAKIFVQTAGSTLTLQQPLNNIARVTLQGLASILGGVNALSLDCYDEAYSIPSEHAAKQSLRLHQILLHESNVANAVDPLGGSYFIESLTDTVEEKAWEYINKIQEMGGWCVAVRNGYIKSEIEKTAYEYSKDVWDKKKIIVGVNEFVDQDNIHLEMGHTYQGDEQEIINRVKEFKKNRDFLKIKDVLEELKDAATDDNGNITPCLIQAAGAGATLGEISGVLKEVFGWEVW